MLTLKQRQEIADVAITLKEETNFVTLINAVNDIAIRFGACLHPDKIKMEPGIRCMMARAAQLLAYYQATDSLVSSINASLDYNECKALQTLTKGTINLLYEMAKTNKIGAIKELRMMTGTSLLWAKTIVDDIESLHNSCNQEG